MHPIPIILDVDTGLDDAMVLAMACALPEIFDIRCVTATFGNNELSLTLPNTLNMLKLCGREDIPVAAGADRPLVKETVRAEMDGGFVHGSNGLGDYQFPFPDTTAALSPKNATDLMYEQIMQSPEPVVVVCLGPHTNAARLLLKYPECKGNIRCFANMGGYIRSGTPSPMSSVNIFSDPHGAAVLLASGIPFYMCSGDLTNHALLSLEEMASLAQLRSPVGKAMDFLMKAYYKTCSTLGENSHDGITGQCLHDPCTLVFLARPELFTYGRYYARVETQSVLCTAMTVIDYEDTLHKPLAEKNLFFVDTIQRDEFARFVLDTFARYETEGQR